MGKIHDLYNDRVRSMVPAERLQLARLILDDLAPSENVVDISDDWDDDDLADLASFSAQHGNRSVGGGANTPRSKS